MNSVSPTTAQSNSMACKQALVFFLLTFALSYAMNIDAEVSRDKRDAGSEAMAKMEEAFKGFKEGFSSIVNNISQSDFYKQFEKIGADLGDKGKELGAKIEETLNNLKKSASSS